MREFEQVVRGIPEDERIMALAPAIEPAEWLDEKGQIPGAGPVK